MDANRKHSNLVKGVRGGYVVNLSKSIYSDSLLFTTLRELTNRYRTYVDEDGDNWIVWVATTRIEDALNVAEAIFKAGMESGKLGR